MKILVEINELQQVLIKHGGRRESHQNLIFPSVCAYLRNLDEPSSLVLFHVQVEPFTLQNQVPGCQISLHI